MTTQSTKKQRHSLSSPCLYTLQIELLDVAPRIWRRVVVDGRIRLNALHHVLQAAMGWTDAHMHNFEIRDMNYCAPNPELAEIDGGMRDEKMYRLNQLLATGDTALYLYDFGDQWQHRITVEAIQDVVPEHLSHGVAWVEGGEHACPPEDAGGATGYKTMLDILETAPYGDEANEYRTWAGLDFDPTRFDRHAANASIERLIWNRWIKIRA